jgi:Rrf2 family protein
MSSLVRVSEAATIALHACLWMARTPDANCRSREVCGTLGFSAAHFAKVMQSLARAGLVVSCRGPAGGSRLARPPGAITLLQVYEAIDGPMNPARCLLATEACPAACCSLGATLRRANDGLRRAFAQTTLAALARSFRPRPPRPGPGMRVRRTGGQRP